MARSTVVNHQKPEYQPIFPYKETDLTPVRKKRQTLKKAKTESFRFIKPIFGFGHYDKIPNMGTVNKGMVRSTCRSKVLYKQEISASR